MFTVTIIIFCLIAIAFAASPFLQKGQEWSEELSASNLEKMKSEKERYYQAIKDVDFEFAEGKLNEKDHDELRNYYKEKAIQTIKSIDSMGKSEVSDKSNSPSTTQAGSHSSE